VTRLELTGLDNTAVEALMEAMAGYALDEFGVGLARAVHRETDGNPFFAPKCSSPVRNGRHPPRTAVAGSGSTEIEDVGLPQRQRSDRGPHRLAWESSRTSAVDAR